MYKYYPQSKQIYEKIAKSKKILINIHPHSDLDTVGSAIAMAKAIRGLRKNTLVITPEKIPDTYSFLTGNIVIKTIDFRTFDFTPYDLFLILDSSSYDRVTSSKEIRLPEGLDYIVIDHHRTNIFTNKLKVIDISAHSTTEIIYRLFLDWKIAITPEMATSLYSGLAGDTVFFKYLKDPQSVFKSISELIEKKADHNIIVEKTLDNFEMGFIKLLGLFISKMKLEKTKNSSFVWAAVNHEEFAKYGRPSAARETAADSFFRCIKGADFGIVMLEKEKGVLSVSFRSKHYYDISLLALKLGGGGHKNAAGCIIEGNFDSVVRKIVSEASKSLK